MDYERRLRLLELQRRRKIRICQKYEDKSGRVRVKGSKDLRRTQAYPYGLGLEVAALLKQHGPVTREVEPDTGLVFYDEREQDSDDSGLEDLLFGNPGRRRLHRLY